MYFPDGKSAKKKVQHIAKPETERRKGIAHIVQTIEQIQNVCQDQDQPVDYSQYFYKDTHRGKDVGSSRDVLTFHEDEDNLYQILQFLLDFLDWLPVLELFQDVRSRGQVINLFRGKTALLQKTL